MPTTNPVPSQDPSDLLFNAGKLDEVVSGSNATYTDRFGISRRTMAGIDAAADLVLIGLGYAPPVAYAAGIAMTLTTQTVEYAGEVYAPKVSVLPFTTSGTFETAKFRLIQGVASADLPALVGQDLQDYAELRAYTGRATRIYITGLLVTAKPAGIAGVFQHDPTDNTSADNGGTVIVGSDGRRWKRDFSGNVSVAWFGVSQFGSAAINTAAIQSAANHSAISGIPLRGAAGTYSVNATINLTCMGDLSEMTISADAATVSPVVRYGTTSGAPTSYKLIKLPSVINSTKPANGWGTAGTGIELANCNTCDITIPSSTGFTYGVSAGGYNSGFAYNEVRVLFVYGNKVNLRVKPAASTGWANENTFHGGRYGHDPADTTNWAGTRDILVEPFDASATFPPDNNLFIRPSVESNSVEYMIDVNGAYNTFLQPRYEGTAKRVRIYSSVANSSNSNLFIGGYQANAVVFTFDGARAPYNSAFFGRQNHVDTAGFGFNIVNRGGDSSAFPHVQGFVSTETALTKTEASTDWTYRLHSTGIAFKGATDAFPLAELKTNGHLYLGNGVAAATNYIRQFGTAIRINIGTSFHPNTDNTNELGVAANRWSVIYAGTGTINTSDEREKQDIEALDDAENRVAIALKGLIKKFRFKDAVQEKGNAARIHVGVIAQEVMAAFEAEGLEPMRYGIICYDEWDEAQEELDEDGKVLTPARPAGNRYGVRYEELLAFIISSL